MCGVRRKWTDSGRSSQQPPPINVGGREVVAYLMRAMLDYGQVQIFAMFFAEGIIIRRPSSGSFSPSDVIS